MAEKRCARRDCGAKKNHPIHLRITPGHHEFEDARPVGIKAVSDDRAAYQRTQQHKDAYAGLGDVCLAHAAGAPGQCGGGIVPHHVFARGQAGGQEAAEDGWPVIAVCAYFNGDVEAKARVRQWAQDNTFIWSQDRNEYPFRINAAMARRIREERANKAPTRI